jgi:3-ketosteroid 9alpha-monooxygenase subunit A
LNTEDLPPFPTGWFAVGMSTDIRPGQVVPRTWCGQEIAVFRDESGLLGAVDAYCPHLGAHLGYGTTGDGCVICPFHGWRWSHDGRCVDMPYGNRVPPAAKTRSWPIVEQDGVVLAWYGKEGSQPTWSIPSLGSGWSADRASSWTLRGHPQEVLENTVDFAHFNFIHQTHMMRPTSAPRVEGPFFEVDVESDPDALRGPVRTEGERLSGQAFNHGPGLAGASIVPTTSEVQALQRLYVTPISGQEISLLGIVNIRVADHASEEECENIADFLAPFVFENWERDVEIWQHKRYQPRPVLNSTEKMILAFRRWYSQFYLEDAVTSSDVESESFVST